MNGAVKRLRLASDEFENVDLAKHGLIRPRRIKCFEKTLSCSDLRPHFHIAITEIERVIRVHMAGQIGIAIVIVDIDRRLLRRDVDDSIVQDERINSCAIAGIDKNLLLVEFG